LSQSDEPLEAKKQMKKMFDACYDLEMDKNGDKVFACLSPEKEKVPFVNKKDVNTRTQNIEKWMLQTEG